MTSDWGILTPILEEDSQKNLKIKEIMTGDLVFFHRQSLKANQPTADNYYPGHCGIYLGEDKFIHASRIIGQVAVNDFNETYWLDTLVGSKDIISDYHNKLLLIPPSK